MTKFYWCIGLGIVIGVVFGFFTDSMLMSTPLGFLIGFAVFERINKKK